MRSYCHHDSNTYTSRPKNRSFYKIEEYANEVRGMFGATRMAGVQDSPYIGGLGQAFADVAAFADSEAPRNIW